MIERFYERKDLLIEVARLYYIEELTQQEIAAQFNITRSNISKILKKAKEDGIVKINIAEPSSEVLKLGTQLRKEFNLKQSLVIPSEKTYEKTLESVGRNAAKFLESMLKDNLRIGIGWGTSLFQMVEHLNETKIPGCSVIQLHGGLGSRNLMIDGYELARRLAHKLGAVTYLIQAPLVVQSKELRDLFLKEPHIAKVFSQCSNVDVSFLGLGTSNPKYSALLRAGLINEAESNTLFKQGAVGMVCGNYYDINGYLLDSSTNERIIGFDLEKLKKLPLTIGVAAGERKVDAIIGALRGKYINGIITDEIAAVKILQKNGS